MNRLTAIFSCGLMLLAADQVRATVFTPAEFSELVAAARAIAHGQIVSVQARASDDRARIETLVTLQVATYLKGDLGQEVTFVVPGGTLGRYRSVIVGAPRFLEGEEVVLFLGARGPSVPYVLRLGQGVLRVVRDPGTGERMVTPAPPAAQSQEWQPVVRGSAANGPMALTELAARVRTLIEAGR